MKKIFIAPSMKVKALETTELLITGSTMNVGNEQKGGSDPSNPTPAGAKAGMSSLSRIASAQLGKLDF